MPIKRYSKLLKDIRKTRHLTQEELADGIYSPVSLSRIENGKSGMKKDNFELLMNKYNIDKHLYPTFVNRDEYKTYLFSQHITDCFMCFNLEDIPHLLYRANLIKFKGKAYHQLNMVTRTFLMLKSGSCEFDKISKILYKVLSLSYDNFDFNNLELYMPTNNLLFAMAGICECHIHTNKVQLAFNHLKNIIDYQEHQDGHGKSKVLNSSYSKFLYSTCLILNGKYNKAYDYCNNQINTILKNRDSNFLHAMYINIAASCYYQNNISDARYYFDIAINSCNDINHWISNYILKHCKLYNDFYNEIVANYNFEYLKPYDFDINNDIVVDTYNNECKYELGNIIKDTRLELNYSQSKLCYGICSNATLSKIEHNEMAPSYFILETLLERLGIYLDDFTFFVSDVEYKFYNFINQIEYLFFNNDIESAKKIFNNATHFANSIDPIINQKYLYYKHALYDETDDYKKYLQILNKSIPNFDFNNFDNFLYSKFELDCIKSYLLILKNRNNELDISSLRTVTNYFFSLNHTNPFYNPRLKYRAFSSAIYNYIAFLVYYDYYEEAINSFNKIDSYLKSRCQMKLISSMSYKRCVLGLFFDKNIDIEKYSKLLKYHSLISKQPELLEYYYDDRKNS